MAILTSFLMLAFLSGSNTPLEEHFSPHVFYSDIVGGPSSGGEGGAGVFVTLSGNGFGETQDGSVVSLGGQPVRHIRSWSMRKIVIQIDSAAVSGNLLVETRERLRSNVIPFKVWRGKIHFVSLSGRDSNVGDSASPWATIAHAAHNMQPGDVTYVSNGVGQYSDAYNAALSVQSSGSAASPIALVAYPGAQPRIGDDDHSEFGVRTPDIRTGPFNNWVIAGFELRGGNTAIKLVHARGWRLVNNNISCPKGNGAAACVEVADSSHIALLGNSVHDSGVPGASKRYQSVYFTTDSNFIDVGWNLIASNHSCRGIQFHSSPVSDASGSGQFALDIHDNEISGQLCDGLNLATIDPSQGAVRVFNNYIHDVGTGPDPPDGESNYACISSPGIVNHGHAGTGVVEVFNNTLFNCGSRGGPNAGALAIGVRSPQLHLQNNLIVQSNQAPYLSSVSASEKLIGNDNVWYGAIRPPSPSFGVTSMSAPLQDNAALLRSGALNPAHHKGHNCMVDYDLYGHGRSTNGVCSIGAIE